LADRAIPLGVHNADRTGYQRGADQAPYCSMVHVVSTLARSRASYWFPV